LSSLVRYVFRSVFRVSLFRSFVMSRLMYFVLLR